MNLPVTSSVTMPVTLPLANPDIGFDPLLWFSAGEQGAWYDPSDLTTLYQDAAGTIPVTGLEQFVGLMLDKSGRGNHAFQATPGNRPTLSARVNLLTYSEQFDNAAWSRASVTPSANQIISPDGTLTADKITADTNGVYRYLYQSPTLNTNTTYTLSVYLKYSTSKYVWLLGETSADAFAIFDIETGVIGAYSAGIIPTITEYANKWYKCTISFTVTSATAVQQIGFGLSDANVLVNMPTTAGKDVFCWGADLRPANIGNNLPAYQRINSATDYDTAGFPLYLKANGTSSAMATNSIDFTSTDKMTVVTGVRKLSDSGTQMMIELSAAEASNNGAFNCYMDIGPNYTSFCRGSARNGIKFGGYAAPISNVVALQLTTTAADSATAVIGRFNGASNAGTSQATAASTGNFGNYALYLFARNQASLWFTGQFYGAIIRGAATDAGQIVLAETWLNSKMKNIY